MIIILDIKVIKESKNVKDRVTALEEFFEKTDLEGKISEKTYLHLAFEGGEAETLVIDGPIFKKRIEVVKRT